MSCVSRLVLSRVVFFVLFFEPVHSANDAFALTPSTCQRCGVWPVLGSCAASTLNTLSTNTGRSSFQIDFSNKFLLRIACFAAASILEIERGALDTAVCVRVRVSFCSRVWAAPRNNTESALPMLCGKQIETRLHRWRCRNATPHAECLGVDPNALMIKSRLTLFSETRKLWPQRFKKQHLPHPSMNSLQQHAQRCQLTNHISNNIEEAPRKKDETLDFT